MENLNTYVKFCPNVYVAKCLKEHEQGETIILTTRRGKENKCIVHNYLGKSKDGLFLYSFTRADGFNTQERAKKKAEKLKGYAENAEKRSSEAFKRADLSEEATGIVFGQPILVGHHSERRHRRTIERAHKAMDKSVAEQEKAEDYKRRSEYWESKKNDINLSMPESLSFFEFKLEQAKKNHKYLKDNPDKRTHSMALSYANKEVNTMEKNLHLAVRLWGTQEEADQINKEKEEKARAKLGAKSKKANKTTQLIEEYGGFFFFGSDAKAFREKYNKLLESGHVVEGEKVKHVAHGLYMPSKNVSKFLEEVK